MQQLLVTDWTFRKQMKQQNAAERLRVCFLTCTWFVFAQKKIQNASKVRWERSWSWNSYLPKYQEHNVPAHSSTSQHAKRCWLKHAASRSDSQMEVGWKESTFQAKILFDIHWELIHHYSKIRSSDLFPAVKCVSVLLLLLKPSSFCYILHYCS